MQPLFNACFNHGSPGSSREKVGFSTQVVHQSDNVELFSFRNGSPHDVDVGPFGVGAGGAILAVNSSGKVLEVVELAVAEAKLFLDLSGRVSQPDWRCAHCDSNRICKVTLRQKEGQQ